MKSILFGIAIAATTLSACTDTSTNSKESDGIETTSTENSTNIEAVNKASSDEVVTHYLHIKNALAKDDAADAATGAKAVNDAIEKLGASSLTAEQSKMYDDVKNEIKEHTQHIADNATNIVHQREHFDLLSQDLYDFVKVLKPSQKLYLANCPMYNDNKGANWLSEVKEIKNPYLGKEMLTCGTVKEEL